MTCQNIAFVPCTPDSESCKVQAAHAPGSAFPATLTECLAGGMADSAPARRTSAHMLGCAALQQVEGQLPESQSALVLSAAWREVCGSAVLAASMHHSMIRVVKASEVIVQQLGELTPRRPNAIVIRKGAHTLRLLKS